MTKRLEPDSFAPLAAHLEPIRHLAKAHQVARLEVFGSTVTGHAHECSDVDLLVVFKPLEASEHAQQCLGEDAARQREWPNRNKKLRFVRVQAAPRCGSSM